MKDGATSKVVVLNKAAVAKIRASSQGASSEYSPWQKHPESMWLKSAVRQLAKWVPTSAEYVREQLRAQRDVMTEVPAAGPSLGLPVDLPGGLDDRDVIDHVDDEDHVDEDHDVSDAEIVDVDFETGEMLEPEPEPVSEPVRAPAPPPSSPDRPAATVRPMNMSQRRRLTAALRGAQINTDEKRVAWVERELGRAVSDLSEVTEVEAAELIAAAMDAAS